jgi:DNA repair exonuclease SbcCD ATPase subunit
MKEQDKFRFQLGEEEPELPAPDEALQRRVRKLGQRVSFLTLMLPCLIALVIYVAYRDITLRVAQTQHSELQSVDRLAADLQQRTDAQLARISDLEATVGAKLDETSKSVSALQEAIKSVSALQEAIKSVPALQEAIKKAEAAVERLNADKADKKQLEDATARSDAATAALSKDLQGLTQQMQGISKDLQALAPFREELGSASSLRKDVNGVSARLETLENSLGKNLTGIAGYMDRNKAELTQIKTELATLQNRKLDRVSLDLELLKAKKSFQTDLDQEMSRIEKTLSSIQRRLDQVEKAFSSPAARGSQGAPPARGGIREQSLE